MVLFKTQAQPLWYCFKLRPILAHCWLSYLAIGPLFVFWHLWLCPCPFRPKVANVQNPPMISAFVKKKKKSGQVAHIFCPLLAQLFRLLLVLCWPRHTFGPLLARFIWPSWYCLKPRPISAYSWLIPAIVADVGHSCWSSSSRAVDVSNPTTSAVTNSNEFLVTISASIANQKTNSSFYKFTPWVWGGMLEYTIEFKNNSHSIRLLLTYTWRLSLSFSWIVKDYQLVNQAIVEVYLYPTWFSYK